MKIFSSIFVLFLIVIFLSLVCFARQQNQLLLQSLKTVFTDYSTEQQLNEIIEKGIWSKDKSVFVVSEKNGNTIFIYAFLKKDKEFIALKLWNFEKDEEISKFGRKLSYYDKFRIIPSIWEFDKNQYFKNRKALSNEEREGIIKYFEGRIISVSYTLQAWKNGQRYTGDFKPVIIRKDGTLDWSQY